MNMVGKIAESKCLLGRFEGEKFDLILSDQEIEQIFDRPLYQEIIADNAFQRLKEIRFLGSIDYLFRPNGRRASKRHTRYQHSLGVGKLALTYSRQAGLAEREEKLVVTSALLHDIGHPPLSHSMEPVLKSRHNISHHSLSEKIIRGEIIGLGQNYLEIFDQHDVNVEEVLAVLKGETDYDFQFLFSCPINIDTIDGIVRSASYINRNDPVILPERVLSAVKSAQSLDSITLDVFWQLKDEVYKTLIQSRMGVLADFFASSYIASPRRRQGKHIYSKYEFSTTEKEFKKDNPQLFTLLSLVPKIVGGELNNRNLDDFLLNPETVRMLNDFLGRKVFYWRRRFLIDNSQKLTTLESLSERYLQVKIEDALNFSHLMCGEQLKQG